MNLWLRMLWMLFTFALRGRVDPLDRSSLTMIVLPNDLDFNGHVNNGRYLTLADVGRMDFVLRSGVARIALSLRARPIVGDAVAKFRRDLKIFDRFELQTRLLGWDDKWVFMEHRFVRKGRVQGVVVIRGLFRSAAGPIKSDVFAQAMGIKDPSPSLPKWVADWSSSCEVLSDDLRAEEQVEE